MTERTISAVMEERGRERESKDFVLLLDLFFGGGSALTLIAQYIVPIRLFVFVYVSFHMGFVGAGSIIWTSKSARLLPKDAFRRRARRNRTRQSPKQRTRGIYMGKRQSMKNAWKRKGN